MRMPAHLGFVDVQERYYYDNTLVNLRFQQERRLTITRRMDPSMSPAGTRTAHRQTKKVGCRSRRAFSLNLAAAAILKLLAMMGGCERDDGRPCVLFVIIDTIRADHVGCYGAETPVTPNADRLADEGARFSQCVTSVPITPAATVRMINSIMNNVSYQGVFAQVNVSAALSSEISNNQTLRRRLTDYIPKKIRHQPLCQKNGRTTGQAHRGIG